MALTVAYYYDAIAKELRACAEGTPLRKVVALRTLIDTIHAFDSEGWLIGQLSENGVLTPLPAHLLGKRHVSEYGRTIPLQDKPVMLQAPPDLPAMARTFIPLHKGNDDNPVFFGTTEVIAVHLVNAVYVYFGPIVSFELVALCGTLRTCVLQHKPFVLSEEVFRDKAYQGRVFVKASDVPRLLIAFEPVREKEAQLGT